MKWKATRNLRGSGWHVQDAETGKILADFYESRAGLTGLECHQNAEMMAAAPELKAEAERRREKFNRFKCCGCDGWFKVCDLESTSADPEADPICHRCLEFYDLRSRVEDVVRLMVENVIIVDPTACATDEGHADACRIYGELARK